MRLVLATLVALAALAPLARGVEPTWHHGTVSEGLFVMGYDVYEPTTYVADGNAPLLLELHGCGGTGLAHAAVTSWNEVAEERGMLVVYPTHPPETPTSDLLNCWHWWEPANQARSGVEPRLLVAILDEIAPRMGLPFDEARVFVAGHSAGAAMTAVMASAYPERFAGAGIIAGARYERLVCENPYPPACDTGQLSASADSEEAARIAGDHAHAAAGAQARRVPALVMLGDEDGFIHASNLRTTAIQWLRSNDWADDGAANGSVDETAEDHANRPATRETLGLDVWCYHDAANALLVEEWRVEGLAHTWPQASTTGPDPPDAARELWRFWNGLGSGCA